MDSVVRAHLCRRAWFTASTIVAPDESFSCACVVFGRACTRGCVWGVVAYVYVYSWAELRCWVPSLHGFSKRCWVSNQRLMTCRDQPRESTSHARGALSLFTPFSWGGDASAVVGARFRGGRAGTAEPRVFPSRSEYVLPIVASRTFVCGGVTLFFLRFFPGPLEFLLLSRHQRRPPNPLATSEIPVLQLMGALYMGNKVIFKTDSKVMTGTFPGNGPAST